MPNLLRTGRQTVSRAIVNPIEGKGEQLKPVPDLRPSSCKSLQLLQTRLRQKTLCSAKEFCSSKSGDQTENIIINACFPKYCEVIRLVRLQKPAIKYPCDSLLFHALVTSPVCLKIGDARNCFFFLGGFPYKPAPKGELNKKTHPRHIISEKL